MLVDHYLSQLFHQTFSHTHNSWLSCYVHISSFQNAFYAFVNFPAIPYSFALKTLQPIITTVFITFTTLSLILFLLYFCCDSNRNPHRIPAVSHKRLPNFWCHKYGSNHSILIYHLWFLCLVNSFFSLFAVDISHHFVSFLAKSANCFIIASKWLSIKE